MSLDEIIAECVAEYAASLEDALRRLIGGEYGLPPVPTTLWANVLFRLGKQLDSEASD